MENLSCPIPGNLNPLQSNGFRFGVNKIPNVSYFCQEVTLPSLSLPGADVATPLIDYPVPGEKLTFGSLDITFLIDEDMANYKAIHAWMIGLGFPKSHDQYQMFINTGRNAINTSELAIGYSDAVLEVLNSSNNTSQTIIYHDVFPTSINSIQLRSTETNTVYLAGQASFLYTLYEFA